MATTAPFPASGKTGLFRSLTSRTKQLVRGEEDGADAQLKPQRAGTLRSRAREQMRTGRAPMVDAVRPPSLVIGEDGWGSDGKLYIKNLDAPAADDPPLPSSFSAPSPSSSSSSPRQPSVRPVNQGPNPPPSSSSLPLQSKVYTPASFPGSSSSSPTPSRPARPQQPVTTAAPPSDAFRSTRRPSNPSIEPTFSSSPVQSRQHTPSFSQSQSSTSSQSQSGRARSRSLSQSQPFSSNVYTTSPDAPPLPTTNGVSLTESYAPLPRSKSGPDQRAEGVDEGGAAGTYQPRPRALPTSSSGGVDASGMDLPVENAGLRRAQSSAGGGAKQGLGTKMKRGLTLRRKEARAQEAIDLNRPPSPLRKAAAPKIYSPADLALAIETSERAAAEQAAAAYRASTIGMGPRKTAAEAKEESRLTENAFY